jgi:hypothetical protein
MKKAAPCEAAITRDRSVISSMVSDVVLSAAITIHPLSATTRYAIPFQFRLTGNTMG